LPSEDEDNIMVLSTEILRLTTVCKDREKILQICDDKEANVKEKIVNLKIKLVESKKVEEGMRKQYP